MTSPRPKRYPSITDLPPPVKALKFLKTDPIRFLEEYRTWARAGNLVSFLWDYVEVSRYVCVSEDRMKCVYEIDMVEGMKLTNGTNKVHGGFLASVSFP